MSESLGGVAEKIEPDPELGNLVALTLCWLKGLGCDSSECLGFTSHGSRALNPKPKCAVSRVEGLRVLGV